MKKLTALFLSMAMLVSIGATALAAERPYKDVTEDDWYFSYAAKVYDDGLMVGTDKTTFAPNDTMTREQFVSVLARMANAKLSDTDKSTFADVSSGKWYSSSIAWAQKAGIVNGIDAKNFGVGQPVTREQMAVMLSNFVRNTDGFSLQKAEKPAAAYKDSAEISSWAKAAVEEMRVYGIFSGDDNGRFLPKQNVTRAACAKVLVCVMMANADDKQINLDYDKVTAVTLDTPTGKWSISDLKVIDELAKNIDAAPIASKEFIRMPDGGDGIYYALVFWNGEDRLLTVDIDDNNFITWPDSDYGITLYTTGGYFKTVIEQVQSAGTYMKK
ncbi:MAG: S-layer homology domain-containing protein [Eubacteriales bacterium]|nr:S-layer homology domain-containing protein [Eubacteriales bacterium]